MQVALSFIYLASTLDSKAHELALTGAPDLPWVMVVELQLPVTSLSCKHASGLGSGFP
jgi:hypothetical protein